jgi:hypothetical protein
LPLAFAISIVALDKVVLEVSLMLAGPLNTAIAGPP